MSNDAIIETKENRSTDNSISTKEFLSYEKRCENYKDSDDEIKQIFCEINKLSRAHSVNGTTIEDSEDVELILKRAEDIAIETEHLLKSSPTSNHNIICAKTYQIPQIKVSKPIDSEVEVPSSSYGNQSIKKTSSKDTINDVRRKVKPRPFSAGVVESKRRDTAKTIKPAHCSPKKQNACKQRETMLEELKDTAERMKNIEMLNVQLNDDNKALRKRLNELSEDKHVAELKLVECEKFVSKIGKEYENRSLEYRALKENESKLLADLNKERNERKNLSLRHDKDASVIQDLQRQVREMEMILRRKHPDSVSALIVAAKSSTVEDNKKKLLEERISRLEKELQDKEDHFQGILLTLQDKFGDMKQKYENHIIDIERQLMEDRKYNSELKSRLNKTNLVNQMVQTVPRMQQSISTQTFIKSERATSAVNRLTQNSALLLNKLKEDSHLVATIKGLQAELTLKQRTIAKINRDTEELKKSLRNMQKEKEVLFNLNPQKKTSSKQAKSSENILFRMNTEMEAELSEARKQKETIALERNSLLESLRRTNEEFILLKKKRIQDLHTLQLAHEKELMQMNMQIYPLQEEIKLLNRTVEILQDKIRAADDKLLKYQSNLKGHDVYAGGDNAHSSKGSFRKDVWT